MREICCRFFFTFFILFFNQFVLANNEIGSRDVPIMRECDSCFTDADFINVAEQLNPENQANYCLISNTQNQQLRTVYAASFWERELDFYINFADIVSTLTENQASFDEHLEFLSSGAEKEWLL